MKALESGVTEIVFPGRKGDIKGEIAVPVMHPLHCLQSRIANLVELGRTDDTARRQAEAAPIVLREYIGFQLGHGGEREVVDTFRNLYDYLARDPLGRNAHAVIARDPLEAMDAFVADPRLDSRYRAMTLKPAIARIRKKRIAIARRAAALRPQRG